jgi:hypothetical protein
MKQVICTVGIVGVLLIAFTGALAQSGKITGQVTDAETGDPLPGVNVVIEGTTQGATSNAGGTYTIINVAPDTYTLRATFVGYADQVIEGVRVNIDLTTRVDIEMQEQAVGLDEVVVQSRQPVVRPDISANVANLSMEDVENLPVTSVQDVVTLQAGFEGLSVRGTGSSELGMRVDGMNMRNPRDNSPNTNISYTSIDAVQVQTGGFNAEYGNVRSGLINVTTKEGPRDRYIADGITRYAPPQKKYFGPSPSAGVNGEVPPEEMGYWIRPYMDPDVAFVGTHSEESPWDRYLKEKYPRFDGFNSIAAQTQEDPSLGDLTPEQAQEVFQWYHRKDMEMTAPDYEVDGSIGGPVPVVSDALGDLRFFGSFRQTQDAYAIPLYRDAYRTRMGQLKVTSNLARGVKLQLQGILSHEAGMNRSSSGFPAMFSSGTSVLYAMDASDVPTTDMMFADQVRTKSDVYRSRLSAHLTHTLGPRAFYNVRVQRTTEDYETGPGRSRDYSTIKTIGGMELDEAPFGYHYETRIWTPTGMRLGGLWGSGRDSSEVDAWNVSADLTSQIAEFSQLKAGVDAYYTDFNSAHETYQPAMPSVSNPDYYWHRQTSQGAGYIQNKLEFEGMVANVGVRLDYFKPLGDWYDYDPYSDAFSENTIDDVEQRPIEGRLALSPRLGVSFPVTADSKLYFNYGHFRNTQLTHNLFVVRESLQNSRIDEIGNPRLPMSKTIAYELGYDQNLFDQYLLRVAGYYKSKLDQPRTVTFHGEQGRVNYRKDYPLNYGDVRGVEFTLRKNRGRWIRGFVNYTYMVQKSGNFGFDDIYENPTAMAQAIYEYRGYYQSRPIPEPYAKFNIELLSPSDFGPALGSIQPLADWRMSLLGHWRAGDTFTWDANSPVDVENNVQWVDYYNLDARFTKNVETGLGRVQLFVDISNLINLKRLERGTAFVGPRDYERYMSSLHLPEDTFEGVEEPYAYIYGDDKPGVYRDPDIEFVPIEVTSGDLPESGISRTQGRYGPLYYVKSEEQFYIWDSSSESFTQPDPEKVNQVLEDKAYINMPNSRAFRFLNPRQFQLGLRITL